MKRILAFISLAVLASAILASCVKTPSEVPVTGVRLSDTEIELIEGQTHNLTATVLPESATDKGVTWSSGVPNVASVNDDGIVTAREMGATTITVTTKDGGYKASCSVIVHKRIKHVESVSLNLTSVGLAVGGSVILGATVLPADADDRSVSWSANPASVITVEQDGYSGIVTAVGPGEGVVTVKTNDGGLEASCIVTVEAAVVYVESVTLDNTQLELFEGEEADLTATVLPEDATDKTLEWITSNPDVATVDADGHVTAASAGSATVTVLCGNKEARCEVTVKKVEVTDVSVQPSSYTMTEGETLQLSASVSPAEADQTVEWSSMDSKIATVDIESGLVTAVGAGTTKIYARSKAFPDAKKGLCELTVTPDTSLKGIALNSAIMTLQVGESRTLTVTYIPSYATNQKVSWTSSNPSVAAVSQEGTVSAFSEGSATVTATSEEGGYTASCEVTVSGTAGPLIFHCDLSGYTYHGCINEAPDPRNGIYDESGFYSKNSYIPVSEYFNGSLYTLESWAILYESTAYWLCIDRKPAVRVNFNFNNKTIRGFAVRNNWFALLVGTAAQNKLEVYRGDFSGNYDVITLDSSTTSAINLYSSKMAASPGGQIQIAARIKDSYWSQYLAVYTIPADSTVPQENLIEANDIAYPSIAADYNSGDIFILSQRYNTAGKQDVMLFQNGSIKGKVDEINYNYSGAIACMDGHYYYAVSDFTEEETRVYKDGKLQFKLNDKRLIDLSHLAPLRVSASGDVYLALRGNDTALYKNGALLFTSSYSSAFNPYCIIE